MSVVQMLIMPEGRIPTIEGLTKAASMCSDPFVPYQANLFVHSGFLPVTIGPRKTGFEYYLEPVEKATLPVEADDFGNYQMVARTGGDMAEMLASLLFLKVVAQLSGAAYVCLEDGIVIPPAEVEYYLDNQVELVREYLK